MQQVDLRNCQYHNEPEVQYCHNCQIMFCSQCAQDHRSHKTLNGKLYLQKTKAIMDQEVSKNLLEYDIMQEQLQTVQNFLDEKQIQIEAQINHLRNDISKAIHMQTMRIQQKKKLHMLLNLPRIDLTCNTMETIVNNQFHMNQNNQIGFDFFPVYDKINRFIKDLEHIKILNKSSRVYDHKETINSLDLSANGNYLLSASNDELLNIVQLEDNTIDTTYYSDFPIKSAKFVTNDHVALAGDRSLEIFDVELQISQQKIDLKYPVHSMDVSQNNIVIGCDKKVILNYDFQQKSEQKIKLRCEYKLQNNQYAQAIKYSKHQDTWFVFLNDKRVHKFSIDMQDQLQLVQSSHPIENCPNAFENNDFMEVNDKYIFLAQMKTSIMILNVDNLEVCKILEESLAIPLCLTLSPCQNFVFAGYNDGNVRIWDIERMILITLLRESDKYIRQIKKTKNSLYLSTDEPSIIIKVTN